MERTNKREFGFDITNQTPNAFRKSNFPKNGSNIKSNHKANDITFGFVSSGSTQDKENENSERVMLNCFTDNVPINYYKKEACQNQKVQILDQENPSRGDVGFM